MSGSSNESPPRFLYKYRSLGPSAKENTLSIIRDNTLWASSPLYFNDPFDCMPKLRVKNEDIKRAIRDFVNGHVNLFADENHRRRFIEGKSREYSDIKKVRQLWENGLSRAVGIVSLAERRDNCLMWSHYADNHKGICIELDTILSDFSLSECRKVIYKKERPYFNLISMAIYYELGQLEVYPIFELFCQKSKGWEYEQEWRYMCPIIEEGSAGTLVKIPPGSITRIIVGAKASDGCQREIEDIVRQSGSDIKVVRARLDDNEYKIVV